MRKLSGDEIQTARRAGPLTKSGPIIIADNIQHSENVGSIIRVAEAFGVQHISFLSDNRYQGTATTYELDTIKKTATSGAYKHLPWEVVARDTWLKQVRMLEEEAKGVGIKSVPMIAIELTDMSFPLNREGSYLPIDCCLIVGNESHGISQEVLDLCTHAIEIPMWGINNSLNVSHALAIVLWEWSKRHLR